MDEVDPVAGLNGMYAYLYKFDTMGYGDEAQHYDYGYHHICYVRICGGRT